MDRPPASTFASTVFLFFLFGSSLTLAQDAAPLRIAVVDAQRVLIESRAGQELQQRLEAFQASAEAELQRLQEQARALQQRAAEGAGNLSDAEIASLQQQFEAASTTVRQRMDELQREGQRMQQDGVKAIEAQLEPVFDQFHSEMQFDLIFNRTEVGIIKASERVEITEEIIRRYNESFSGL